MKKTKIILSILVVFALVFTLVFVLNKTRDDMVDREYQENEIIRIITKSKELMSLYGRCMSYEEVSVTKTDMAIKNGLTTTNTTSEITQKYNTVVYDNYMRGTLDLEGNINVSIDSLLTNKADSQGIDKCSEFYVVSNDDHTIIYSKMNDEQDWRFKKYGPDNEHFDITNATRVIDIERVLNEDLLRFSKLQTNDENYIITLEISKLITDDEVCKTIFGDSIPNIDELKNNIEQTFKGSMISYVFDKNCYLLEITIDNLSIDFVKAIDSDTLKEKIGKGYDVEKYTAQISISKKFEKFGEITENDAIVPDDIKNNAKEK